MKEWFLLVIEDDPDGRTVVDIILQYYRVPHEVAASAEEALEMLQKKAYTGVLIDLHLPGMTGWHLLQAIQKDPRLAHLPCVAVTGYSGSELNAKVIAAGFKGYIPKPLEPGNLIHSLQQAFQAEK